MPVTPLIDRTTLVSGPAHLFFATSKSIFCTKLTATLETTWLPVKVAGFGRIQKRKLDEVIKISASPAGQMDADIAAFLWPYGATAIGAEIFGATDAGIIIHTLAGQKLTMTAGAVTKMPSITLGAGGFLYGDFEITCVVGKSIARTTANSLYTLASIAWSGVPTPAHFLTMPSTATWALGSPETIIALNGWTVDFDLQLTPRKTSDLGTFGMHFVGCEATAKCIPIGYAESKWASMLVQGSGAGIGAARTGADLTLAQDNPGISVVLQDAVLEKVPLQFDDENDRVPECEWVANRDISTAYGALFSVGITPAA
jgi:hypothetical protein